MPSDPQGAAEAFPQLRELAEQLEAGRDHEAVRLFMRMQEAGSLRRAGEIREAVERAFGVSMFERLLAACANFSCLYCTGGFLRCERCLGTGKTEDYFACAPCRTFGAIACDFCSGSGFAAYNFFPSELWHAIASIRIDSAIRRLETCAQAASRRRAGNGEPESFLQYYGEQLRSRAVFANFLEIVRHGLPQSQPIVARLVARCWRAIARAEVEMSHVLTDLCAESRGQAAGDEKAGRFHEDRLALLEEEAVRLTRSARQRINQIRGHQHA